MKSIRVMDEVGKAINCTLTELLNLEDFVVVGYEQHAAREVLITRLL